MNDRTPLVSTQPESEKAESPVIVEGPSEKLADKNDTILHRRMTEFFNIDLEDKTDVKLNDQIREVTEWAGKSAKTDDRLYMQSAIKKLQSSLGFNDMGKPLVEKLHKYITLNEARKRIETEMEMIE